MAFGTQKDLVARLKNLASGSAARPLAILAGSGLTVGTIPGVNEILNSVRKALEEEDRADLDDATSKFEDPAERYQAAFNLLSLRKPPADRDRIIQLSTLKAYRGVRIENHSDLEPARLMEYEADADHWELAAGVGALGRIWAGLPIHLRGPIVTTNFDPLCEIAIKRAGQPVSPRIVDADGAFLADVRATEVPQVVHMHGYWRESATLSMTSQLTLDRPALNGSLRALLSQYTLLVVGYGAWRDAVTTQLLQIIREQAARDLDVLWCFFGTEAELSDRLSSDELFGQLRLAPGNVQFYTDIDANSALPAVEVALQGILTFPDSPRLSASKGALIDWTPVASIADTRSPGEQTSAAIKFFDGRLPNWLDASSNLIPTRDMTHTLVNQVSSYVQKNQSSLNVLLGASGEGKTTILLQAALALSNSFPQATVLFNSDGRIASVDEILSLPPDSDHLLIIDEAYHSMDRLRELASRLQESGRTRIHVVAASRDTDWTNAGGFTFAWSRYLEGRTQKIRGINRPDAVAIVQAWEALGNDALGSLASLHDTEQRIKKLMDSAAGEREAQEGAFLGALLATRHGAGLSEHVRQLLLRLDERPIHLLSGSSRDTLLHAAMLIAIPHAHGVRALNQRILARAMGFSVQELVGGVLLPLGDEAAVSYSADSVLIRHRLIAREMVSLAPEIGIDIPEILSRVVTAAAKDADEYQASPSTLRLAYLSQAIDDPDLALVAANAAVDASPNRLSYRTSLSRTYRLAKRPDAAAKTCLDAVSLLFTAADAESGRRAFFTEWGVAEGNLGHWAKNTVLAAIGLQDYDSNRYRKVDDYYVTMNCLATSLRRLHERERTFSLLEGLAGLAELGASLPLSDSQRDWIRDADAYVLRNGGSPAKSLDRGAKALSDACKVAHSVLETPLSPEVRARGYNFGQLVDAATRYS